MKWITPAEARLQIMAFNKMMGRLEKNEYTSKRLKTCDLNKLPGAFPRMIMLGSIAKFNKNQERVKLVLSELDKNMIIYLDKYTDSNFSQ